MSTQNCVVTRSFRGAELFLSSLENQGFVWSADRSNALRMNSDEALATVKRFEQWSVAEPESAVCNVLDSKGHVLSSGSVVIPQREPSLVYLFVGGGSLYLARTASAATPWNSELTWTHDSGKAAVFETFVEAERVARRFHAMRPELVFVNGTKGAPEGKVSAMRAGLGFYPNMSA